MPYHVWGDEWFEKHGDDFYEAINYCVRFWHKWGRINTAFSKEKYGTFRHNVSFYKAYWPIQELIYPSSHYYRGPRWLMRTEITLGTVVVFLGIPELVFKWQAWVYNYAIQKACKKYPHLTDELVSDSDHPQLIKGAVDGEEIHDKYWTKL